MQRYLAILTAGLVAAAVSTATLGPAQAGPRMAPNVAPGDSGIVKAENIYHRYGHSDWDDGYRWKKHHRRDRHHFSRRDRDFFFPYPFFFAFPYVVAPHYRYHDCRRGWDGRLYCYR
jgi:hypothetical protein